MLQDLNQDDVMVLDAGAEIYIWVGKDSSQAEQDKSFAMAEVFYFKLSNLAPFLSVMFF